jgi:hypothetical protein
MALEEVAATSEVVIGARGTTESPLELGPSPRLMTYLTAAGMGAQPP